MFLESRDLSVGYRDQPLFDALRMDVDTGEVLVVTGRNGSGKSSLLRCLAGQQRPLGGTVTVEGRAADDRDPRFRRSVAALLDGGAWYPNLTAAEHLSFVQLVNDPLPDDWFTAADLTTALALDGFADTVPGQLSSGQRQRLAVAMVLARPSRLLLLDEPERHLDETGRNAVGRLVVEYADRGGTVVLVTHDASVATGPGLRTLSLDRDTTARPAGTSGKRRRRSGAR
ncbi:ABC transporter ATP-binding protein [Micromonospora sagamiensis]|uniref:Heme ABC exporter ATP-binding subunit CcmA n=1 Tax=Micromonospora sagamiensis TaxID=47875 RepID=A0A562WEY1_9ACTN|nr:ABC transporter ATP-binding protein [Micromonospora sagamiensis]TWJ28776.1 heme ABC exporter ATP-binding subunit CcmA [Micromonospora sagamiensis]BCL12318.1 ABC transporter ATP-binding protein [Micromonospora sagamiensis]